VRFIFNFIFFGILFYVIYLFFPEAFHTLVSWADQVVNFFKELVQNISDRIGVQKPSDVVSPTGTHSNVSYLLNTAASFLA
jgi:hypothetical protein